MRNDGAADVVGTSVTEFVFLNEYCAFSRNGPEDFIDDPRFSEEGFACEDEDEK